MLSAKKIKEVLTLSRMFTPSFTFVTPQGYSNSCQQVYYAWPPSKGAAVLNHKRVKVLRLKPGTLCSPVSTGRVHGPCHEHGSWTRVVCTELKYTSYPVASRKPGTRSLHQKLRSEENLCS